MLPAQMRISVMGGYCAPVASDLVQVSSNQIQVPNYSNVSATTSATLARRSYGQSGCAGLGIQWFSKKDIGFGLRLTAFIGSPLSSTTYLTNTSGGLSTYNFTDYAFSFQFVPHLAFKHDFQKLSLIAEMGLIVGANNIKQVYNINDIDASTINQHGGVMLGFYSSLGLGYHISKVVDFTLAVHCNAASYSPTEWNRASYFYMGQNVTSQIPQSSMQGTYSKNYQPGSGQDSRFTVPFSNVGFTAGFAFKIVRKKPDHPNQPKEKRKWEDTY
jgi:hypothetical protein